MPFNRNHEAYASPHPGNPSRQALECFGYFFREQLQLGNVSYEKIAMLYRARFDRKPSLNKNHDLDRSKFDDSKPNLTKFVFNLFNFKDRKEAVEGLMEDFEYLMEGEAGEEGSEKFLRLVNKFGFSLEFYSTFRKRALAALHDKGKRNPTRSQIEEEIARQKKILKGDACSAPDLFTSTAHQVKNAKTPTLKLFFDDKNNVSFEYPTRPAPAASKPVSGGANPANGSKKNKEEGGEEKHKKENDSQEKTKHSEEEINRCKIAFHNHQIRQATAKWKKSNAAAATPVNYTNDANIFGTFYDRKPVQTPKPSLEQSLTSFFGFLSTIIAFIFDKLKGLQKESEQDTKNQNPYHALEGKDLEESNADLFEEYRNKLPNETIRNRLVAAWHASKNASGKKKEQLREKILSDLKNELANAGLGEDLQALNFKLCLRKLEKTGYFQNVPYAKADLTTNWRQGGALRKQALNALHDHMATAGLFNEMEDSLRTLEYTTRDKGLLVANDKAALEARGLYAKMLKDLHDLPIHMLSTRLQADCYKYRKAMLDAIQPVEQPFAQREQAKNEWDQQKQAFDTKVEEFKKLDNLEKNLQSQLNQPNKMTAEAKQDLENRINHVGKLRHAAQEEFQTLQIEFKQLDHNLQLAEGKYQKMMVALPDRLRKIGSTHEATIKMAKAAHSAGQAQGHSHGAAGASWMPSGGPSASKKSQEAPQPGPKARRGRRHSHSGAV